MQQIIQETPILAPFRELPAQHRPEERDRTRPHAVLHKMQAAGPRHLDHTTISPLSVERITHKEHDDNKYKRMRNQPSAGHRLRKQDPAYGLIDQVRQQGSQCNEPVIKMTPDGRDHKARQEEDGKRDSYMAEDEHCYSSRGHTFKKRHIRENSQCGDL